MKSYHHDDYEDDDSSSIDSNGYEKARAKPIYLSLDETEKYHKILKDIGLEYFLTSLRVAPKEVSDFLWYILYIFDLAMNGIPKSTI